MEKAKSRIKHLKQQRKEAKNEMVDIMKNPPRKGLSVIKESSFEETQYLDEFDSTQLQQHHFS